MCLTAGEIKPKWIDLRDLDKINIGMSEEEVIKTIGFPAQLIQWETQKSIEKKKVFYRVREILSISKKKTKFILDNVKNNYIKLKKKDDKIFIKPSSLKLVGKSLAYQSLDGQYAQIGINSIDELVLNGKKIKLKAVLKFLQEFGRTAHIISFFILKMENYQISKVRIL